MSKRTLRTHLLEGAIMALDSSNVRVAITGAIYVAPTSTTAPTDASTALDAGFIDLGYVSEDGVTKATDRSTNDIIAWQNAAKVRTVVTDSGVSFQFVLIETTVAGVGLYTGATVDPTTGKVSVDPGATGGRKSFVFDVIDGTKVRRIYVAEGEVSEIGDQVFTSGDAIGYDITINGYASAALDGDTYVEYLPELIAA